MKIVLITITFAIGTLLAVHLSMNAAVGNIARNPRMGNAVFWLVGATMAVLIALTDWDSEFFTQVRQIPPWLWLAGAIGACLVFGVAALIPQLGAGTTNVLLLAGQVIGGLVIAHLGVLSSPVERINGARILGTIIMIIGASMTVMGRIPFIK